MQKLLSAVCIAVSISTFVFLLSWSAPVDAQETGARAMVPQLPETPYEYASPDNLPPYLINPPPAIAGADNQPATNVVNDAGATLGRVLFYDTQMSANNTVSCSSCHVQANGFSDSRMLSVGFDGGTTGRHSMSLANARYYAPASFFWDQRAATLEAQVLMPIQDSVEMGMDLASLETKLAALDYYPDLFEAAFGTTEVTSERVSLALAQFVRSMASYQSKFDEGLAAQPAFSNFTQQENLGRNLFNGRGRCSLCHITELQIADQPHNIGLDATTVDQGVGNGRMKVPSLRNVAVTAPYMHDGRFADLEAVVVFYDSEVENNPNLSPRMRGPDGQPIRLNLNATERAALVAFLTTFTDESFVSDVKFSDPFVEEDDVSSPTAVSVVSAESQGTDSQPILFTGLVLALITGAIYAESCASSPLKKRL